MRVLDSPLRIWIVLFEELEKNFRSTVESGRLAEAFVGWRSNHPALQRYSDPDALIAEFRDESVSYEEKSGPLIELCRLVQTGDELAITLLLELYTPGMRETVKDNVGRSRATREDLESAAVEGFLQVARVLGPQEVKPHKALNGGARKSVLDAVRAAREFHVGSEVVLDMAAADRISGSEDEWLAALEAVGRDAEEVLEHAERLGKVAGPGADAIRATRVEGVSLAEYAAREGISYEAAKVRRNRAENPLIAWLWVRTRGRGEPPPRRRDVTNPPPNPL